MVWSNSWLPKRVSSKFFFYRHLPVLTDHWTVKSVYEEVLTSSRNSSTVNNKVASTVSFLSNPKKRVLHRLKGKGKTRSIPKPRELNERFVAKFKSFHHFHWPILFLCREKKKGKVVQERNLERNDLFHFFLCCPKHCSIGSCALFSRFLVYNVYIFINLLFTFVPDVKERRVLH